MFVCLKSVDGVVYITKSSMFYLLSLLRNNMEVVIRLRQLFVKGKERKG